MLLMLTHMARLARALARENMGEMSLQAVIGLFVLLVAYMSFPDLFHGFFQHLHQMFNSAVDQSFGGNDGGSGSGPKNIEPQMRGTVNMRDN